MMKITTVTVGVPVYSLKAEVTHSIVRKPTVFERMVMRLSRRGVDNHGVGEASLRDAFESKLGVQGVPLLLESTVQGLLRLGVLRTETASKSALLDQPIRTLRLTPSGEEFYNRNSLPSSPGQDFVEYFYMPWSNSLSSTRPRMVTSAAPEVAFDEEKLKPGDASSLIRRELEATPPRFLKKDSRVVGVVADIEDVVSWLALEVELHASSDGYLDLKTASGKALDDWLKGLEPVLVRETFLDSVTSGSPGGDVELTTEIIGRAKRLELAAGGATTLTLPSIDLPGWAGGGLTIQLRSDPAPARWAQNEVGASVISCPRPNAVPPQLVDVTVSGGRPTHCRVEGDLALTWAGSLRYVRVRAELEGENVDRLWTAFSDELAGALSASTELGISAVPLAWGSDRPLNALSHRLVGVSLSEVWVRADEFLKAAKPAGQLDEHVERIIDTLVGGVESSQGGYEPTLQEVDRRVRAIKESLGEQVPIEALTRSLLRKATPPSSAVEVQMLLNLEKNPQQIPVGMLNPSVLALILEAAWQDPSAELTIGGTGPLRTIEVYRVAQAMLDSALGRQHAQLKTTAQRVTATRSVGEALRAADRWLNAVADPALAHAVGQVFPLGLRNLRDEVQAWTNAARANVAQIDPGTEALVFDSNTLMDHPDALRKLRSCEVGIVPNRVIQELDGLKRSQDLGTAQKARAANRAIDEMRGASSLRFEPARVAFIPVDLGPTDNPDNQILSVAIAYSIDKVTLLTSDKNLRIKAEASSITAKDWLEIQESRGTNE